MILIKLDCDRCPFCRFYNYIKEIREKYYYWKHTRHEHSLFNDKLSDESFTSLRLNYKSSLIKFQNQKINIPDITERLSKYYIGVPVALNGKHPVILNDLFPDIFPLPEKIIYQKSKRI